MAAKAEEVDDVLDNRRVRQSVKVETELVKYLTREPWDKITVIHLYANRYRVNWVQPTGVIRQSRFGLVTQNGDKLEIEWRN